MESVYKLGVIVSAIDKLTGPVRKMAGSIQGLQRVAEKAKKMVDFGDRMGITGAMVQAAGVTMITAFTGILAPTMQVESAMAALKTVTTSTMGSVEASLNASKQAAIDWARVHSDSADTFLRTSYMMASAGLNDIQAIEGTRTALRVAKATMADTGETANTLAILYNNIGNKTADVATEMNRLGDVLTRTQQYFQFANLGQLTEGLKYAVPSALRFRSGIEELNVVLGQLNNAGLQGSMAGTAYSATMRQLTKASKELGFAIAKNADGGVSLVDTLANIQAKYGSISNLSGPLQEKFQELFGDEGIRAVTLLTDKIGDMRRAMVQVQNSAGAATEAQRTMEAATGEQFKVLKNNLDELRMVIAGVLLPALNQLFPTVRGIITSLGEFAKTHPGLTRTIVLALALGAGVLAILAPILTVTAGFISMMGYGITGLTKIGQAAVWLYGIFKSGKIMVAVHSVGRGITTAFGWGKTAILAAGRSLVQFGGWARQAASSVLQFGRQAAIQAATGLRSMAIGIATFARQAFMAAATALPSLIASIWSFTAALLANPVTWVVMGIGTLVIALVALYRNWDIVTAFLGRAWDALKAKFAPVVEFFSRAFAFLEGLFKRYGTVALSVLMPIIGIPLLIVRNWEGIKAFFFGLWNNVLESIKALFKVFREAGAGLWEAFVSGLKSVLLKPVEVVKSGLEKLRKLLPFSDAKEGPLSTLTKSGAAMIHTLGAGMRGALPDLRKTLATSLATTPLAFAAPIQAQVLPPAPPPVAYQAPKVNFPQIATQVIGQGKDDGRKMIIQQLHIHVQKLESPEDLYRVLKRLEEENG